MDGDQPHLWRPVRPLLQTGRCALLTPALAALAGTANREATLASRCAVPLCFGVRRRAGRKLRTAGEFGRLLLPA